MLTVSGNIEQKNAANEARFDRAMLEALGQVSLRAQFVMASRPQVFEGVPLRAVLERVGAEGNTVTATALDNYRVQIPLDDLQYNPIIAMRADGKDLTMRDKGPLWIVYPRDSDPVLRDQRYDSRWVWQLNRLRVE